MFQRDQHNPTISVLLLGGTNDHTLHRTLMLSREFIVPSHAVGRWERFVRTKDTRSVRAKDGTLGTYRVYEFAGETQK